MRVSLLRLIGDENAAAVFPLAQQPFAREMNERELVGPLIDCQTVYRLLDRKANLQGQ